MAVRLRPTEREAAVTAVLRWFAVQKGCEAFWILESEGSRSARGAGV
jgi:hypothetical protein